MSNFEENHVDNCEYIETDDVKNDSQDSKDGSLNNGIIQEDVVDDGQEKFDLEVLHMGSSFVSKEVAEKFIRRWNLPHFNLKKQMHIKSVHRAHGMKKLDDQSSNFHRSSVYNIKKMTVKNHTLGLVIPTRQWRKLNGIPKYNRSNKWSNFDLVINGMAKKAHEAGEKLFKTFNDWKIDDTLPEGWLKRRSNCGSKWLYLSPEPTYLLFHSRFDIAAVLRKSGENYLFAETIEKLLSVNDNTWTEDLMEMYKNHGWKLTEVLGEIKKYEDKVPSGPEENDMMVFQKHEKDPRTTN